MDLKSELLKSIWYAFTSLDVEQSGKVSKSQLKATEGTFCKETFDDLCWTMTSKKNCKPSVQQGLCSPKDCFKLFCLFNLLSEDRYPLVIIQPEIEYLLTKISNAMSLEWDGTSLEELLSQNAALQDGMSVWEFLEHLSAGQLLHVESKETFSLAVDDVFMEMYHSIIKKGYLLKKGHVRRNWQERWFVLKPSSLMYYVNEDLKEKKGEVLLEEGSVVENLSDKEGRRCLFCVNTPIRTYEMSASDMKQRVDWVQAIQTALRLRAEGKSSLHQELKLSRRKQREILQRSQNNQSSHSEPIAVEVPQHSAPEQQGETKSSEPHIESTTQKQREVEAKLIEEEKQEREKQQKIQRDLERQLEEAKEAKEKMTATLTEMAKEVQQQKKMIHELQLTQVKLEEALNAQIHARLEEDGIRQELERQLEEEQKKLVEVLLYQSQLETSAVRSQEDSSTTTSPISQPTEESTEEIPVQDSTSTATPPNIQRSEESSQHNTEMLKNWKIQHNHLMKPITPGDKVEHVPVKSTCLGQGQALTSSEFIAKVKTGITQEKGNGYSPSPTEEEEEQDS
ncbi:differentially expressed in FDCP 6 homolog isoform X3 [Carassius carassius]|uniref:differentially expressed in FDCP 6 homolog isoform X3 n=1 Tax=Carassius carassius TaxID=217509 RepID=UPI00286869FD|nr:differentially expressed in FDCP 6 homolog isoform X3 [Carassius carassius]